MQLKSSIFLWVSLATIVPLTAFILGITTYSEHLYQKNVNRDLQAAMANIISELDFRLNYERDVINSLATSPAMTRFFPVLQQFPPVTAKFACLFPHKRLQDPKVRLFIDFMSDHCKRRVAELMELLEGGDVRLQA